MYRGVRSSPRQGHTWPKANQPCVPVPSISPVLRARGAIDQRLLSLRAAAEPAREPQGVYDAVVVGAGPAGLVAAKHMQAQGTTYG